MRTSFLRPAAAIAALALAAACDSATAPVPLDAAGVQADVGAATAAVNAPATASFGALGPQINLALAAIGGGAGIADLPAALLSDPNALATRAELRARVLETGGTPAVIPAVALGKTFEYDVVTDRYVAGLRTGAPANGVRFVLYAVDPITKAPVEPLVETGYVDLTRTFTQQQGVLATARVEAWSGGTAPVKVLDYGVTVQGTLLAPTVSVAGFAKNASDSLSFLLSSALAISTQSLAIDWQTALASHGFTSHVVETITGGNAPQVTIDGSLTSLSGRVGITGTIVQETGGTLTVKVNGQTFATIQLDSADDQEPTILNASGQPLTGAQAEMLRQILDWFRDAFALYEDLLDPVKNLLDVVF